MDRLVPLPAQIAYRLQSYIGKMRPEEKVFKLAPASITNKVRILARKAGVPLHAHSLRHKYACSLLEKGGNIRVVQELLGHTSLNTTQVYLSLRTEVNLKVVGWAWSV